ncbi:transcription termination factor NusA [Mycoplasmatota bacterium zrk1]
MISKDFFRVLSLLAVEREIPVERLLEIFRKGLESAYKKQHNKAENVVVEFQPEKNKILLFARKEVIEEVPEDGNEAEYITLHEAMKTRKSAKVGDVINIEITPKDFGRLAASQTKQILNQGLRDYEKELAYNYFKNLENEMISAIVVAMNESFITLNLEKNTVTNLPVNELVPGDQFKIGDRIRVYITKVEIEADKKRPKIYVSRKDRNLVRRMFENIVPEIMDGTVEIMGLARDAGDRSKVAVMSFDQNVDPIGACLGHAGSRIKEIIRGLDGEKVDVFAWHDDPKYLIANSLQPAVTVGAIIDPKKKEAIAIVADDYLSLAIGKRGQNVRLAVQASGWKIDIKSLTEALKEDLHFERVERDKDE